MCKCFAKLDYLVGKSGCTKVYKWVLPYGWLIAILKHNYEENAYGKEDFFIELDIISHAHHLSF